MLTFFRRIRKGLLGEGATSKYLLYAIGEIALVVIGILIALSINNWNTEKNNRKTEKEILSRIIEDLESDMDVIGGSSENNEERMIRGVWVLENLGKDTKEIKEWNIYQKAQQNQHKMDSILGNSIGETLAQIRYYTLFEESNVTIQEIMATGKLDIIKNDEVKIAIQSHYAEISRLQYLQRLLIANRDDLVKYLLDFDISVLNKLNLDEVLSKIDNPEKLIALIENFLSVTASTYNRISGDDHSIKKYTERLIIKIEEYLSGL